jgi:hypothetical protein
MVMKTLLNGQFRFSIFLKNNEISFRTNPEYSGGVKNLKQFNHCWCFPPTNNNLIYQKIVPSNPLH